MRFTSVDFQRNVTKALHDPHLQEALQRGMHGFVGKRAEAVAAVPEFERLRDEAREIKNHTLEHLDYYLEIFEQSFVRSGGHVHWAADAAEARRIVLEI